MTESSGAESSSKSSRIERRRYLNAAGIGIAVSLAAANGLEAQLRYTTAQNLVQGEGGMSDVAEARDWFGSSLAAGDFDGDGKPDLAIVVNGDGSGAMGGAVHVVHASPTIGKGLDSSWYDVVLPTDGFVLSLAAGDFNCDGSDDLAAGLPFWQARSRGSSSGAVVVFYGGKRGLTAASSEIFHSLQPTRAVWFGWSLASGDFDGGCDDLAVGDPAAELSDGTVAGAVNVLVGSQVGLIPLQYWDQDHPHLKGSAGAGDRFGFALAAGDFDGESHDDLAIGAPGADSNTGRVHVLYSGQNGLSGHDDEVWEAGNWSLTGGGAPEDYFGAGLVVGNFDGDAFDDLVVGVPGQRVSGQPFAGSVHVLYGWDGGLDSMRTQFLHQDTPDIAEVAEAGDRFGVTLAAGDFDGDGADELAIGVYLEDLYSGGVPNAGEVHVIDGRPGRGLSTDDELYYQDQAGIATAAERNDYFGRALAVGDFDANGSDDLAVGAHGENLGASPDAGIVHVLYAR